MSDRGSPYDSTVQISFSVPYDPRLLRRTLTFLARSQLRGIRALGGLIVLVGLLLVVLSPADLVPYALVLCGVAFLFGIVPLTVAYSMRRQSAAIRHPFHLTVDDEWVQVSYPLIESRFRWAAVDHIVETPEVWHIVLGSLQAQTVPKSAMTPQQQAEFAALVSRLAPTGAR